MCTMVRMPPGGLDYRLRSVRGARQRADSGVFCSKGQLKDLPRGTVDDLGYLTIEVHPLSLPARESPWPGETYKWVCTLVDGRSGRISRVPRHLSLLVMPPVNGISFGDHRSDMFH
jgi:hypothetical protein